MLNQVALSGTVVKDPKLKFTLDKEEFCILTLELSSRDGEHEQFDMVVWGEVAKETVERCGEGSIVATRGRVVNCISNLPEKRMYLSIDRVTHIKLEAPKN